MVRERGDVGKEGENSLLTDVLNRLAPVRLGQRSTLLIALTTAMLWAH